MLKKKELVDASKMVSSFFPVTPLILNHKFSENLNRPTYFKLENLQITGSFKIRGALNCIGSLSTEQRSKGVITCSSGNHGRAVATVAKMLDVSATICVPTWIDPVKLNAMKAKGAEVIVRGETYDHAESNSLDLASQKGLTYVHPFDDLKIIAGQGTVATEILSQLTEVGDVLVPLSGGGLAGGISWVMKEYSPNTNVVSVSADRATAMLASLDKGNPVQVEERHTIASALSGGIDLNNKYTFNMIKEHIRSHAVVSEEMIVDAMNYALSELHLVVEGGGAVGIAALFSSLLDFRNSSLPLVIVVSGGNVAPSQLLAGLQSSSLIKEGQTTDG
jgi:threonine dehydratase